MKIYAYNVPRYTHETLSKEFPHVVFLQNTNHLNDIIHPEDKVICMWDDTDTVSKIHAIDNEVFPSRNIINFSANREEMSRFVDHHSQFPVEREYVKLEGNFEVTVPRLLNSFNVVAKAGEEHRGQNKFLMYPGQTLTVKDSVIFEEFLDNAESFRVLLIGEEVFIIEYFDDPNRPKSLEQRWIKNINPILIENEDHDLFQKEIDDTIHLSKILGFDYIGVDYVKNADKTLCVEINTFPGVRLNERTRDAGLRYWRKKIKLM